jgi:hypothetical protein
VSYLGYNKLPSSLTEEGYETTSTIEDPKTRARLVCDLDIKCDGRIRSYEPLDVRPVAQIDFLVLEDHFCI